MAKRTADADCANASADSPQSKRRKVTQADFKTVDPTVLPEDCRLDLADSDVYYVKDFVDAGTAKRWYRELLELDSCASIQAWGTAVELRLTCAR